MSDLKKEITAELRKYIKLAGWTYGDVMKKQTRGDQDRVNAASHVFKTLLECESKETPISDEERKNGYVAVDILKTQAEARARKQKGEFS